MPSVQRNLAFLFAINTSAAIYSNMTRVFVPLFIRGLHASVFEVSLAIFVANASATVTMMLGGYLSDRYGRKRTIMLSGVFWLVAPFLFAQARSWPETILYASLTSMAFSFFVPARAAMITDVVRRSTVGRTYGLMNIAWPIGGLLGPFLGGMIADRFGWPVFFYSLGLLAAAYMLVSLLLEESAEKPGVEKEKARGILTRQLFLTLLFFVVMHVLANTSRGILSTVFPFYLTERFGKTKTEVGVFFSVGFGLATLISQIPGGLLADKLGRKKTMVYNTFPIPFLSVLFLFTSDYLLTLLVYMAITGLWSATWPASTVYITEISPSGRRGLMVGVRLTAVRLGFTIGPLIGGYLWDNFDIPTIFYVLTVLMAASLLAALLLKE